jgi:hypothetical protein
MKKSIKVFSDDPSYARSEGDKRLKRQRGRWSKLGSPSSFLLKINQQLFHTARSPTARRYQIHARRSNWMKNKSIDPKGDSKEVVLIALRRHLMFQMICDQNTSSHLQKPPAKIVLLRSVDTRLSR